MPTELLFDLDQIDLDQVAVPPEEVGRVNPQCGAMRQLDHVIWMSEEARGGIGIKRVTEEEFWVPLHIPGRPLMPGVLMIEASAQLCSVLYRQRFGPKGFLGFTRCDETVFRGQVVPGDDLLLLTTEISCNRRRFVNLTQGVVDRRVVFESKITGMVL